MRELTGIIADIQRYSLHDGPGIRTSVFVKGCNMNCVWCHNPETIAFEPEILLDMEKCIGCGQCENGCFADARVVCGREMTVDEVTRVVMRDKDYYGEDGGVTITGGEPSCQAEFCAEVLRICRESGIHTAVETNLCSSWDNLLTILRHADLVMADLKIFDPKKHLEWTGVDNSMIKENFHKVSELGVPIILRTPVIPGINATGEEIESIAAFAGELHSLVYYELLPYHSLGLSKGKPAGLSQRGFDKPAPELLAQLGEAASKKGVDVRIAGKRCN